MKLNEMKKELEELEKIEYYEKSIAFTIIKKYLLEDRAEDDGDMSILTTTLLNQIIDLFIDCYNIEDLMKWLSAHNYDPIIDFRYADIREYGDFEPEELEEAKNDCLFNDEENEILVMSW
ncbi:MAG: hypothetical protein RBR50_10255 [Candidatus Izemoplasmatales bacterium]|nr:hypothetical protein [Candidatus Izemoplasmatales bacterium]